MDKEPTSLLYLLSTFSALRCHDMEDTLQDKEEDKSH